MLQDLSSIGHIVQNAIVFNSRNWERLPVDPNSLLQTVRRLFTSLREHEVKYVLVGGIALPNYVKGRNTQDIDLIMDLSDVSRIPGIKREHREPPSFLRGTFEALQTYVGPGDIAKLRNIVDDIQGRIRRFQKSRARDHGG